MTEAPSSQQDYAARLLKVSRLSAPAVREAIRALALPVGSTGLDAACGIGCDMRWLAEAVGEGGKVVGMDLSTEFLDIARQTVRLTDHPDRLEYVPGNLLALPFDADRFDWLWCRDAFWPGPNPHTGIIPDPVQGLGELARVVRPGGTVALVFWSGQKLLPGYPALEARLEVAQAQWIPYLKDVPPERHYLAALGWMRAADLLEPRAHCFSASVHGPLDESMQETMSCVFDMLYESAEPWLSPEEWQLTQQLCRSESDAYLARDPAYYGIVHYTVFRGRVAS